jgi:hypothetical protein
LSSVGCSPSHPPTHSLEFPMKTLPLVLFALVLMTTAGQSVAQVICNDGQSPTAQCNTQRSNEEQMAESSYRYCLPYANSGEDPAADAALCGDTYTADIHLAIQRYEACVTRNQCLWGT